MSTLNDNLVIFQPEASASILKAKIGLRGKLTEEIVAELYRAKEFYSNRGIRSDLLTNDSKLNSFIGYLGYVGLLERTAYRWLERYIPEENKLITYEELSEKKRAEARIKLSEEERNRDMIAEYRKTGVKPSGWTAKLDKSVKDTDEHLAKIKEQHLKDESDREQRANEYKDAHTYKLNGKNDALFNNALKLAADSFVAKSQEREDWKEKIRLSDGGKEDAFMDAIIDYMETLENDSRRIEACNNIIKICRNISVELQRI